ncbi:MAG: hypothetical protein AAF847_06675 [Bacteroidota bacterium]
MNAVKLKSGILEMVISIDDLESLRELKTLVADFVGNHSRDVDYWDEMSEVERTELEVAIEESKDESNHVSHDEVMKKYRKWLDK